MAIKITSEFYHLTFCTISLQSWQNLRDQFHQYFSPGFYAHRSPKSAKNTVKLSVFFALLGSLHVKALHKMLVKSTLDSIFSPSAFLATQSLLYCQRFNANLISLLPSKSDNFRWNQVFSSEELDDDDVDYCFGSKVGK